MEIRVNNQTINFTLENEKTLGDIYKAIQQWAGSKNFNLLSMKVNQEQVPLFTPEKWEQQEINAIELIDIELESELDARFKQLETIHRYFEYLERAVASDNSEEIKKMLEDFPSVYRAISNLIDSGGSHELADSLKRLIATSGLFQNLKLEQDKKPVFFSSIDKVRNLIFTRMKEIATPAQELRKTISRFKEMEEQFSEVSVLLQTGKDSKAMSIITEFSELSEKLLRTMPYLQQTYGDSENVVLAEKKLTSLFQELQDILQELSEAFDSKDYVLIGDIMEYEIAERITELQSISELLPEEEK
ncbi:MAG: hypothetical protein ACLFR1_08675 [Spirochaetia bacterium]